jgi:hypothetical protein
MAFLGFAKEPFNLALSLPEFTLEVRRPLASFDPINLVLMRTPIDKSGALLMVL